MPRVASGEEEKAAMSAEARRAWFAPTAVRGIGGRREPLEISGVLLRLLAADILFCCLSL